MSAKSDARSAARKKGPRVPEPAAVVDAADLPVVGPREPCPCGSGKRYKACHGKRAARASAALVRRPFEGLPGECDLVALREVVPAATVRLRLGAGAGEHAGREITLATLLPMASPALVRADGEIYVGLQTTTSSGDPSRDVGHAIELALAAEPGTHVAVPDLPGPGARLQDLLDLSAPFEVNVHEGFDYWVECLAGGTGGADDAEAAADADSAAAAASLVEQANTAVVPTVRVGSVTAAYWCRMGPKAHVRWVLPDEEEAVLDALARLHEAGQDTIGEGSVYVGAFRAHGLIVPVWDLLPDTETDTLAEPLAVLADRLAATLADPRPLTADERRTRSRLQSRQVTLR